MMFYEVKAKKVSEIKKGDTVLISDRQVYEATSDAHLRNGVWSFEFGVGGYSYGFSDNPNEEVEVIPV
jgi:hypothetical protein